MKIHQASELSGLPAKTIRYYESVGLVPEPLRAENGYRDYSDKDVHFLGFVHCARTLGFSIEDCELLMSLYLDSSRKDQEVDAIASEKIVAIEHKIRQLRDLRDILRCFVRHGQRVERPEFPLLDERTVRDLP